MESLGGKLTEKVRFAFKEVQGGEEKRFDIVITYNKKMYILELKIWRDEEYHKKGLTQLGEYLEQYGLDEGYLLIFDFRKLKAEMGKVEEKRVNLSGKDKNIIEMYRGQMNTLFEESYL